MTDQAKVSLLVLFMFVAILFISLFRGIDELEKLTATQDSLAVELQELRQDVTYVQYKLQIWGAVKK